jgi:ERCC4-type nuclease
MRSHPIPAPTTLLVDSREPKAIVKMLRTVSNLDVKVKKLSVGDYVVEGFLAIERKTPLDFVQSVIGEERRLFHQTSELLGSGLKPIVLLEGDIYEQCSMTVKSVDGMLSYLVMRGIYLIHTRSSRHSAAMIAKIVRHTVYGLGYPDPVTCAVAPRDPRQAAAYLLSCIPGVSGTLAKRLIDQFGSVNGVCRATRQDLLSIHGIGPAKANQIITCLGI